MRILNAEFDWLEILLLLGFIGIGLHALFSGVWPITVVFGAVIVDKYMMAFWRTKFFSLLDDVQMASRGEQDAESENPDQP